jgi:hypothetical protein
MMAGQVAVAVAGRIALAFLMSPHRVTWASELVQAALQALTTLIKERLEAQRQLPSMEFWLA